MPPLALSPVVNFRSLIGQLPQGDSCSFRHSEAAKASGKTCRFGAGVCRSGEDCPFIHSGSAGRGGGEQGSSGVARRDGANQQTCHFFLQGSCSKGVNCPFAHPGAHNSRSSDATLPSTNAPENHSPPGLDMALSASREGRSKISTGGRGPGEHSAGRGAGPGGHLAGRGAGPGGRTAERGAGGPSGGRGGPFRGPVPSMPFSGMLPQIIMGPTGPMQMTIMPNGQPVMVPLDPAVIQNIFSAGRGAGDSLAPVVPRSGQAEGSSGHRRDGNGPGREPLSSGRGRLSDREKGEHTARDRGSSARDERKNRGNFDAKEVTSRKRVVLEDAEGGGFVTRKNQRKNEAKRGQREFQSADETNTRHGKRARDDGKKKGDAVPTGRRTKEASSKDKGPTGPRSRKSAPESTKPADFKVASLDEIRQRKAKEALPARVEPKLAPAPSDDLEEFKDFL